jgi:oxygen-dependent protoporphyrinogen oxidase
MKQTILVAGGGMTGLTAAYQLQKLARQAGTDPEIIVVEKSDELGGKVQTEVIDGLVIEAGPESFVAYKPWLTQLCVELGLPMTGTNPALRQTYIAHHGRLEPLPVGMNMMIPTQIWPFLTTKLLSFQGKLRAAAEPLIPAARGGHDESIGSFVRRRFGQEVLERIAGPLMGGIYGGDWNRLSLKSTFPQFMNMEREKGSLLLAGLRGRQTAAPQKSPFVTVPGGLKSVIRALVCATEDVRYLTGTTLTSLSPDGDAYAADLSDGTSVRADAVVLATPAYATATLVKQFLPEVALELQAVPYASSVVVALAYDRSAVDHPLDGTGFLVPPSEPQDVAACTWVSSKWKHAAPAGTVLLRCYLRRSSGKDWVKQPDEAIVQAARSTLRQLMNITADPILIRVFRWPDAMPQYLVGHLERMDRVNRAWQQAPGLALAGAAFRGVGLPDCVREGITAAAGVARHLGWECG